MKNPYYTVKTRNWYGNRFVKFLLDHTPSPIIQTSFGDNDTKYFLTTDNIIIALLVWVYWMLLRPFSGGWTYITNDSKPLAGYKSFYL